MFRMRLEFRLIQHNIIITRKITIKTFGLTFKGTIREVTIEI